MAFVNESEVPLARDRIASIDQNQLIGDLIVIADCGWQVRGEQLASLGHGLAESICGLSPLESIDHQLADIFQ
jgi:hypothetical protein